MHPASVASKAQMKAQVILASSSADHPDLTTIHVRVPRIIWAEVMTHRDFSRNARSSRAVPVKTMLAEIREAPFVPWHWGLNQSGMQAGEENNAAVAWPGQEGAYDVTLTSNREHAWQLAAMQACDWAESFNDAQYHKQVVNRLTEPFSFIDALISSTSWNNFYHLRDHDDAEPHFRDLAVLMREAIESAPRTELAPGEWHLPYITDEDVAEASRETFHTGSQNQFLRKISAARCARISYKPFDGDASYEKELSRYEQLVGSAAVHASPLEHQAAPDYVYGSHKSSHCEYKNPERHGNFTGWVQSRQFVAGESVPG